MLYNTITNKKWLNIYYIFVDIFIGFSVFALFFGVFANYFYDIYTYHKVSKAIDKELSFYDTIFKNNFIHNYINNYINNNMLWLVQSSDDRQPEVIANNLLSKNNFIYLILGIIITLFLILLIPILLGLIPYTGFSLKYILMSYIFHIIIVISFELILLLVIFPYIIPINFYTLL